jgi:hypothetical protein
MHGPEKQTKDIDEEENNRISEGLFVLLRVTSGGGISPLTPSSASMADN